MKGEGVAFLSFCTLVVFSSFLNHGCEASQSEKTKYGLSFNVNTEHPGFSPTAVDNKDV